MKIEAFVSTSYPGLRTGIIEIPNNIVNKLSKEELNVLIDELVCEWRDKHSDYGYDIVSED